MYIETMSGARLLRPASGKVISNADREFHSELVYMGREARLEDFVEVDPPAPPVTLEEDLDDAKSALRTLGVSVDG